MQSESETKRNGTRRKVGNALDASKRNFTLRLAAIVNRRAREYAITPGLRGVWVIFSIVCCVATPEKRWRRRVLPFMCDFLTDCVFWATFCNLLCPTHPAPLAWRVLLN